MEIHPIKIELEIRLSEATLETLETVTKYILLGRAAGTLGVQASIPAEPVATAGETQSETPSAAAPVAEKKTARKKAVPAAPAAAPPPAAAPAAAPAPVAKPSYPKAPAPAPGVISDDPYHIEDFLAHLRVVARHLQKEVGAKPRDVSEAFCAIAVERFNVQKPSDIDNDRDRRLFKQYIEEHTYDVNLARFANSDTKTPF